MTFLDTGILVAAVLETHPEHGACLSALEESERPSTNGHALAETFATLTGFYKVPTEAAAELTLGLRDSVKDGLSGLLYEYGNIDQLAQMIVRLLKDKAEREKLERGGLEWAARFNWDTTASKFLDLCCEVAEQK